MATSRSRKRSRKEKKARLEPVYKGLYLGKLNYWLLGIGLILILIGFVFLYLGDTVISVISLTLGYVFFISIGLYVKPKPREEGSG